MHLISSYLISLRIISSLHIISKEHSHNIDRLRIISNTARTSIKLIVGGRPRRANATLIGDPHTYFLGKVPTEKRTRKVS